MTKFLLFVCLISAALFGFANASSSAYAYKPALAQVNQYRKLFNAYQKRDAGVGQKKMDDEVVKRAIMPTLQIAQDRSSQDGATTYTVLEGLLEFLANNNRPVASRAAKVISTIAERNYIMWRHDIQYIFQNNPINKDNDQFFSYLLARPRNYRQVVIGIVLAMVSQDNYVLIGHPDMHFLLDNDNLIGGSSIQLGHSLRGMGNGFTYSGGLPPLLVIHVIVAAVAVSTGEVMSPQDIPLLLSSLQ